MQASNHKDMKLWRIASTSTTDELARVAGFLNTEFGDKELGLSWTKELMAWKLGPNNPAGKGIVFYGEIDGLVIASVSLTLKRFMVEGQIQVYGEVGDAYTSASQLKGSIQTNTVCATPYTGSDGDQKYIARSIFGRLAAEVFAWARMNGVHSIYGTPNASALPGWTKRLRYSVLSPECGLRSTTLLTARLLVAKRVLPQWAEFLGAATIAGITRMMIALRGRSALQVFRNRDEVREQFDSLWERSCRQGLVKDRAWMEWRYLNHSEYAYDVYTCFERGKMCGWIVIRESTNQGIRTLVLCDWLIDTKVVDSAIFLFKVLQMAEYQSAIVKMWAYHRHDVHFPHVAVLPIRGRGINVIHKCVGNDGFEPKSIFSYLTIGATDNV